MVHAPPGRAAHHRWQKYCAAAGTGIGIHQLRHAHASKLINSGVSIEVVRRRLGHASAFTCTGTGGVSDVSHMGSEL